MCVCGCVCVWGVCVGGGCVCVCVGMMRVGVFMDACLAIFDNIGCKR